MEPDRIFCGERAADELLESGAVKLEDMGDTSEFIDLSNRYEGHEDRMTAHIMRVRSEEEKIRAAGGDPHRINCFDADRILRRKDG